MAISAEERRELILGAVRDLDGPVRLTDLATHLGIPAVTVRRDVAELAEAGRLGRSHGFVSLGRPQADGRADPRTGPGAGLSDPRTGPPAAASGVRQYTLGLLVPSVGSYFDALIAGARAAATAGGSHLILGIAPYEAGDDRAQAERLLESGADGLLLTPNLGPDLTPGLAPGRAGREHDWLDTLPVPAVLVERGSPGYGTPGAGLDAVSSDHRHGVLLALHHLAGLGHGSVLLAARGDSWTAREVRAGYEDGTRRLGLAPLPVLDTLGPDGRPTDPGELARRIAEAAAEGVRAVLVHNDQDAIQLPRCCARTAWPYRTTSR